MYQKKIIVLNKSIKPRLQNHKQLLSLAKVTQKWWASSKQNRATFCPLQLVVPIIAAVGEEHRKHHSEMQSPFLQVRSRAVLNCKGPWRPPSSNSLLWPGHLPPTAGCWKLCPAWAPPGTGHPQPHRHGTQPGLVTSDDIFPSFQTLQTFCPVQQPTCACKASICFSRFFLASSSSSCCSCRLFFSSSSCLILLLRLSFWRVSSWSSSCHTDIQSSLWLPSSIALSRVSGLIIFLARFSFSDTLMKTTEIQFSNKAVNIHLGQTSLKLISDKGMYATVS